MYGWHMDVSMCDKATRLWCCRISLIFFRVRSFNYNDISNLDVLFLFSQTNGRYDTGNAELHAIVSHCKI